MLIYKTRDKTISNQSFVLNLQNPNMSNKIINTFINIILINHFTYINDYFRLFCEVIANNFDCYRIVLSAIYISVKKHL